MEPGALAGGFFYFCDCVIPRLARFSNCEALKMDSSMATQNPGEGARLHGSSERLASPAAARWLPANIDSHQPNDSAEDATAVLHYQPSLRGSSQAASAGSGIGSSGWRRFQSVLKAAFQARMSCS